MTIRTLVARGLLVGLLAGILAGAFAFLAGEPHVERAIVLEEAGAAAGEGATAHGHDHGHDHGGAAGHSHGAGVVVSRPVQQAGLFLATGLYGLAVGGIFALVYAGLRGRVGPRNDGLLAIVAAGTAFLAIVLVPFVKYPANPPAVGDPDTIDERTLLYLVMVLVGLAATAVAVGTARRAGPDPWRRWTAAVTAFLVPVVAAWLLLPPVDEVPEGFPATLLWDFRLASLGTQLVFWSALGVLFGLLTERATRRAAVAPAG
ncbi:membrane protein [Thermobispora bispora]|jgi:predicted cobalt transporter CbtA|uniref:Uncharacterized protein n=2 Tax=Streptosporangiaceae TaxID=2004 RepID=D6Y4L5_THEBD|nr:MULTISPECIES: CbtA family protein [Streptosporangiaceae]ADG89191.1 conserved hypothetical protein [Thermobispora bispora DSM 43833]QSI46812.1 hypothetical protein CYL17_02285 [Thermobispora bispora]TQM77620.1 putative cobalt transporter CbtA [Thermopolyspora flexuosa]GGM72012.1 membrane protein [Thermopolyspora flexuosa]